MRKIIELFLSKIFSLAISILPGWLLKKIFKPEKLAKDIEIDFMSGSAIKLSLNSQVPMLCVWLQITNKSATAITVERLLLDVWFGQPTVDGAILRKIKLGPKQTVKDICFKAILANTQIDYILAHVDKGRLKTYVSLNTLTAYCESKIGPFEVVVFDKKFPGESVSGIPN